MKYLQKKVVVGPGQELPLASASGPFNGTTTNLFPHDAKVLIYATFSDQKTYLSWVHLYKRPWFGVSTSACHAVMKVWGLSQLPRVAEKGNTHVQHQAVPNTGKQSDTLDFS